MTTPVFRMSSASIHTRRYVQLPLSSPRTGVLVPGQACQFHGANFPLVCATPSALCQGPRCYGPNGRLISGWHACRHEDQFINMVPGPGGRQYTVDRRPGDKTTPGRAVHLYELEPHLMVNWAEGRLLQLANQEAVKAFMLDNGAICSDRFEIPGFSVVESCGIRYAGLAFNGMRIEISSWILRDYVETESVLRHELAHIIVSRCGLRQPDPHGENFIKVLKVIAPFTWERDRHWHGTPAINQARSLIHPDATPALPYTVGGDAGQT